MAHKLKKQNKLLILAIFLTAFAQVSWAQPWTENFDDQSGTSYVTEFTCSISGTWTTSQAGNFDLGTPYFGSSSVTINDDTPNAHLTTPSLNTCGTVSFYYYPRSGSGENEFELQVSENGGAFATVGIEVYDATIITTYVPYSYAVNSSASQVKIRVLSNNMNAHLIIDDFSVTAYAGGETPETGISPWKSTPTDDNIYYENRVGIGTYSPEQLLDVKDDILVGAGGAVDENEAEFIGIRGRSTQWNIGVENKDTQEESGFYIGKSGNKDFYIGDNGSASLGVKTSRTVNLDVNGKTTSKEISVAEGKFEVKSDGQTIVKKTTEGDALDVINDAPENSLASNNDLIWGRYRYQQNNNPRLLQFNTWDETRDNRVVFSVRNQGQVGIGVDVLGKPKNSLTVAGDIEANNGAFTVNNNGTVTANHFVGTFDGITSSQWGTSNNGIYYDDGGKDVNIGITTIGDENYEKAKFSVLSTNQKLAEFYYYNGDGSSYSRPRLLIKGYGDQGDVGKIGIQVSHGNFGADLALGTHASKDAILIKSNGNVGIGGAINPGATLDVAGNLAVTYSSEERYSMKIKNSAGRAKGILISGGQSSNDMNDAQLLRIMDFYEQKSFFTVTDGNSYFENGNVGIGTPTPTKQLQIGTIANNVSIYNDYLGTINHMVFESRDDNDGGAFVFRSNSDDGVKDVMTIDRLGNVGIGTDNPQATLDINAENCSDPEDFARIRLSSFGGFGSSDYTMRAGPDGSLDFGTPSNPQFMYFFEHSFAHDGAQFRVSTDALIYTDNFRVDANSLTYADKFKVNADALSYTTNFKVKANGEVYARKITVTTDALFPDYVFADNYNLRPLSELEAFIAKNKHLPNIPTAKTVETTGLDLGEMNRLLLEKVEELTLYMIEQNKKIETLQSEVEILKTK